MSELSLEGDLSDLVTPPEPETAAAPAAPAAPPIAPEEPAADGSVEVQGQKIDVGPLLAAERKRVREATEQRVRAEYEPIRRQASELEMIKAELAGLRAQMAPPKPPVDEVADSEAEVYARRHQLYNAESQLDLKSAKSIIAENRAELRRVSRESVDEVVQPIRATEQKRAAHDNFMRIAATKDSAGEYVFRDPATHSALLEAWNALPDELRAVPEVGEVVVKSALGELALRGIVTGKRAPAEPAKEPVFSEAPGGGKATAYTMSTLEKKVADSANIKHADFEKHAKTYVAGQPNSLE